MNDILSAIYRNLLESRFSASLSCPDYRRAIIRVEQCMDELRQALPAEEQELPEQASQNCSGSSCSSAGSAWRSSSMHCSTRIIARR